VAEHLVVVVAGVLGGVVNMAGALMGGVLADRMNRRLAYAACGALSAVCAVAMVLAPATPGAFTIGCLAYQLANGLCYAVFYAFVLELVGQRAQLQVIDGGVGLSPEEQAQLFRRFYRSPEVIERKLEGTGLGLLICRGIVEAHAGTITAASRGRGEGTTITVTLPLSLAK